jgi:glycosyltransferase involved in cell wall biosynthesis
MRVSVVTAVRNGAATIGATLASVGEQTHPDIEHVVVDGASADRTLDIVRSCAKRPLRVLSEPDRGVYDAFNKGLSLSTGDVIGYLNCGDSYWSRDVVARVAARFSADDVEAVFGDLVIVDSKDTLAPVRRYRSSRFRPSRLAYGFMPAHPTLFLRRQVYERHGGYDASYRIAGDFEFVARVFGPGALRYAYLHEVMVRMPRGGLSTAGPRSNWIITREMKRACDKNAIDTNVLKLMLRFPVKLTEFFAVGVD